MPLSVIARDACLIPRLETCAGRCHNTAVRRSLLPLMLLVLAGCHPSPQSNQPGRALSEPHWWAAVPKEGAPAWEILPQEAGPGEVILSKRNELGLLSNFAATPFTFHGQRYASLEGFWQMMKYPEGPDDPRATFPGLHWAFTRQQVAQMTGFEAKRAGTLGEENMKKMGIALGELRGKAVRVQASRARRALPAHRGGHLGEGAPEPGSAASPARDRQPGPQAGPSPGTQRALPPGAITKSSCRSGPNCSGNTDFGLWASDFGLPAPSPLDKPAAATA